MVCEWLTWNYECDLPNWLTLLIEVMIGAGIAVYFFAHQRKEKQKKRRWALQRIAEIYDSVDDQINVLEEMKKEIQKGNKGRALEDPEGRNYQTLIELPRRDVQHWALFLEDAVNLHSNDLDQGIKEITKFLIFQIKRLNDTQYLKAIDDIVECNKSYHKKLISIKPNPIEDYKESEKAIIDHMKNGGLSWEDEIDHLYYGKLNKKKQA